MSDARVLPVEGRALRLSRSGRTLLDGVDITLGGAGLTAVLGANGAGKSLVLRVLAGLVRPDSGDVLWGGRRPDRERALGFGMVFQKPVLLRRSARANLEFALARAGTPWRERRRQATTLLEDAGLGALATTPARALSGGEQQLLALLRALATRPQVLALDEPTANLDPRAVLGFESLVSAARATGTKVVLVTHDTAQAARLADDVVFFYRGQVVESAGAREFFEAPRHQAARAFLEGRLHV